MSSFSNRHLDDLSRVNWTERLLKGGNFLGSMTREFFHGVKSQTLPWSMLYLSSAFLVIGIRSNLDTRILTKFHISILNPHGTLLYWPYCCLCILSPFWIWAGAKAYLARQLRDRLVAALTNAGLKNTLNKVPMLIFDKPVDQYTRRLRLSKAGYTKRDFENAKHQLESSLQIYIDAIEDRLEYGTVDFIYGHKAMPTHVPLGNIDKILPRHFVVGITRSKTIIANLKEIPHLLIAGITNGGKSTFLRQLITTLYLRTPGSHFTLIDLKGGLEFQLFEKYKNIHVTATVEDAIESLKDVAMILDTRMTLLRLNNVKDIQAYEQIPLEERKKLPSSMRQDALRPYFIVVDEAAEIFLAGQHASSQYIQSARKCLSQVARQGRSAGVHLFIATQRPDVKAIDSQVKANLSGILTFHMANAASSMTVLGSWRAAELPAIPGRAIWKAGNDMVELQTPYLDPSEVETLMRDFVREEPMKTNENTAKMQTQKSVLPPSTPFPDLFKNPEPKTEEETPS